MNNFQYREHAVDIHSHIIPGVDDGARTTDEAVDLITLDREEGMNVIFATPHYGIENGYAPEKGLVQNRFNELLVKRILGEALISPHHYISGRNGTVPMKLCKEFCEKMPSRWVCRTGIWWNFSNGAILLSPLTSS